MKKINGDAIEMILLGGHLHMFNYKAIERFRKPSVIMDNIAIIIAMLGAIILIAK